MSSPPHVTEVRVRWSECDPAGIVHFANYLTYFELGCIDYLRSRGADWRAIRRRYGYVGFPRVEAHARYKAPARYDDLIAVHTRVADVARKVVTFEFQIYRQADGALLTEGHVKIAPTNTEGRAAIIPPALAAWFRGGPLPDDVPFDAAPGPEPPRLLGTAFHEGLGPPDPGARPV